MQMGRMNKHTLPVRRVHVGHVQYTCDTQHTPITCTGAHVQHTKHHYVQTRARYLGPVHQLEPRKHSGPHVGAFWLEQ